MGGVLCFQLLLGKQAALAGLLASLQSPAWLALLSLTGGRAVARPSCRVHDVGGSCVHKRRLGAFINLSFLARC